MVKEEGLHEAWQKCKGTGKNQKEGKKPTSKKTGDSVCSYGVAAMKATGPSQVYMLTL